MDTALESSAKKELEGVRSFVFYDEEDIVLASTLPVDGLLSRDLVGIRGVFQSSRETAIRGGLRLQNRRFEVHRFDLDQSLVYGRAMHAEPLHSEAIAVYRVQVGPKGIPAYGIISFLLPELTAKKVPELVAFCKSHLQKS